MSDVVISIKVYKFKVNESIFILKSNEYKATKESIIRTMRITIKICKTKNTCILNELCLACASIYSLQGWDNKKDINARENNPVGRGQRMICGLAEG